MQVLPNEGSYAGRAVYRAANLYQAMDQFSKHRYDAALKSIKASEEWPENLGVGKPYDDQIDKRLEDYLEAKVYEKKGETAKAQTLLDKVSSHPTSTRNFESAGTMVCCRLSWKHGPGQRTVEQQICFQRDYSLGNWLPGYKL